MSTDQHPDSDTPDTEVGVVELRTPADVSFVATLRLTAASLAARCDLTVDDIEDLRLAVDEACALLLPHAAGDAALDARFELGRGRLVVRTAVRTGDDGVEPNRSGFAWTVLDALASSVDVDRVDDTLAISVTKSRATAPQ